MPVHFIDIFPTLLEIAEGAYLKEREGRTLIPLTGESLVPSFEQEDWERKRPIFWEHEGNCGVRLGRYKLVRRYPDPFELYDMEKDRTELRDIAQEQPEKTGAGRHKNVTQE